MSEYIIYLNGYDHCSFNHTLPEISSLVTPPPQLGIGVTTLVLVYIHMVIVSSTGKIQFACEQTKIVHFLDKKTQRQKT